MAKKHTGVFPVNEIKCEIGISYSDETSTWEYATIADMESASIAVETGVETWVPMETEGWQKALATAKSATVSMSGKRNIGDPGNDHVASLLLVNGQKAGTSFKMTFPNGAVFIIPGVVSITDFVGGDSTAVAPLAFDIISNGKPSLTAGV